MDNFSATRYVELVDELKTKYQSFPSTISIETLCLCNAFCSFCPYDRIKRKGSKLPDNIINKIINEISQFPENVDLNIVLARVNETFLDKRWYDISKRLIEAKENIHFGFFSNGSTLSTDVLHKLNSLSKVQYLNISLNYSNKEEYESNIKLNFNKITDTIQLVHKQKSLGNFAPQVIISRVGSDDESDNIFKKYVYENYPLFKVKIASEAKWLCDPVDYNCESTIGTLPCRQWFQVHILADGNDAFCCIDGEGQYSVGNIYQDTIIDIYNNSLKKRIRGTLSRHVVDICKKCSLLP